MKPKSKRGPRKKVCKLCIDKVGNITYRDEKRLQRAVTDRGKIVPRRISGNCSRHQLQITRAVKRARVLALLAFAADTYK